MSSVLTHSPADRAARVCFGRLITHGTFYNAGMLLSNVSVVLPFICAGHGMAWIAALLYPSYCVGTAAGNVMAPYILDCTRRRHLVVAGAVLVMATLVVLTAAVSMTGGDLTVTLLVTSVATGIASGVTNVAFTDVASSALSDRQRGDLLLSQGATGSVLATGIAVLVVPVLAHDSFQKGVDLLLFGAVGLAIAGVAALFIEPGRCGAASGRPSLWTTLRDGVRLARAQVWFRRYAMTQLVFVPVALGASFYSLRAAQTHDSLTVVVVVSSVALVVGSRVWRVVYRSHGVRGLLTGSSLLSTAAAAGCLAAESLGMWSSGWVLAIVFVTATVAGQAVYTASISWVGNLADPRDRPTLISVGAALTALATCIAGAVLGQIALVYADRWPVVVMLALSAAAVAVARRSGDVSARTSARA